MTKFILDAGHGGMAFGHYLTPGKRSPEVPPGIYEGEFNRDVCSMVAGICRGVIDVEFLNPGAINIPLTARVKYINQLYRKEKDIVLLSVHANAIGHGKWVDSARGYASFVAHNASETSNEFARLLRWNMIDTRMSNRGEKCANFTIIKKTHCPAVLLECGFMTHPSEAKRLASKSFRMSIALAIYIAMAELKKKLSTVK